MKTITLTTLELSSLMFIFSTSVASFIYSMYAFY